MLANIIIQKTIDELGKLTGVDFFVYDVESGLVAATSEEKPFDDNVAEAFAGSSADTQSVNECNFYKICEDDEPVYVLVAKGRDDMRTTMGKVIVSQLSQLLEAYKVKYDRNSFFQNILMDNMLQVDMYNKAQKLHLDIYKPRMVYLVETKNDSDGVAKELMKSMFVEQGGNYITAIDEKNIILIKDMKDSSSKTENEEVANTIADMLASEAMLRVRVSYGLQVRDLKDISRCYKEAKMALDVGEIFYSQMRILSYESLGIGRIIYQLPLNLCKIFVSEVFGDFSPDDIDEETLITINKFFENNLNVSETARQLYIHRNTLVYRMEKLQKAIGLDMRVFDDAVTFKIAMMVVDYVKYIEKQDR